ncbi:lipopolysaccharide export system permease protein [Panacagrimonas perspica]|uniref:Lipopolysaccharide export system permease protein n=1 Tax=Panacagrimonas perspica TaxID=381431 RepID=A0A4R7P780_9GAMM|nr:LptF/LptG family permease [Panacagrimonas perspica]TDU28940.1 lipopolysaccharide export system permease protein [Panacagrimonas perspica]THD02240.1 hypothetical protein B1810_15015 [Panacagrimonas perspica]
MNGVLARYLRRRVATQVLALVLVLTALMQLLELLDVTGEVLDRNLGMSGLMRYALLRTPSEVVVALPLAVLLGSMSAFYAMARNHEIVAMRCAGMSLKRLVLLLLPVPLALAAAQFVLSDRLVPHAEEALKAWWDQTAPPEDAPDPRWVQTRDGPASFDRASPDGRKLTGLRIYERGADGLFAARITAEQAQWHDGAWNLSGVEDWAVDKTKMQRQHETLRRWEINLRPDDVMRLDLMQPHLSSSMLSGVLSGDRVGAQPIGFYQTMFYRTFTTPLTAFIMLLLAVPTAQMMARSGGGGGSLLIALGLGLAYLLCDGIMAAMGTSGRIPALASVAGAPVTFTLIALVQLQLCDRT